MSVTLWGPSAIQCSTSGKKHVTLHLNAFRGEPAITEFDWPFTTPLPGYFSPFPHGTCPLSVTREYSGLAGGPAGFTPNFTGSVLLGNTFGRRCVFVYGALTRYGGPFQRPSTNDSIF